VYVLACKLTCEYRQTVVKVVGGWVLYMTDAVKPLEICKDLPTHPPLTGMYDLSWWNIIFRTAGDGIELKAHGQLYHIAVMI